VFSSEVLSFSQEDYEREIGGGNIYHTVYVTNDIKNLIRINLGANWY